MQRGKNHVNPDAPFRRDDRPWNGRRDECGLRAIGSTGRDRAGSTGVCNTAGDAPPKRKCAHRPKFIGAYTGADDHCSTHRCRSGAAGRDTSGGTDAAQEVLVLCKERLWQYVRAHGV